VINEEFARETTAYWLQRLREARIPSGPVNDFGQALSDPQILARDMVIEVELKRGERVRMPGSPMKFPHSDPPRFGTPPDIGEHTDAVLGELLAYEPDRISDLRSGAAIA